MTDTNHGTFFIERRYDAAPPRVFAAWSDADSKRAWHVEGKGWEIRSYELDFREGGRESGSFRFLDGVKVFGEETTFSNETVYDEIVPNERLIFTYSMSRNGKRFSVSLATVEFKPDGGGTRLMFTEHAAFFEGADGMQMREQGWRELLGKLDVFLNQGA
jgi:uncharacterized protein YndB with AHSA1/START domain